MPHSITILGRKVPIKYISQEDLDKLIPGAAGVWSAYDRVIFVHKYAPKKIQRYIILHESVHVVFDITGLDQVIPAKLQEICCQSIASLIENILDQKWFK